jgi:hypothetical protein
VAEDKSRPCRQSQRGRSFNGLVRGHCETVPSCATERGSSIWDVLAVQIHRQAGRKNVRECDETWRAVRVPEAASNIVIIRILQAVGHTDSAEAFGKVFKRI